MAAMPSARERLGYIWPMSSPATASDPASRSTAPVMILMSVDFPAPFSPTRPCTSPAARSNDTPRSARTPEKDFSMALASSSGILRIIRDSHDARAEPDGGRSLSGSRCSIPTRSERRDGIDRTAGAVACKRQNRRDVGREGLLQRLQRHQRIVLLLIPCERFAVDETRLHIRPDQLDATRHQRLDRVGDVVRLIESVRGCKPWNVRKLGIDELVEDEEQLKRLDRSRVQIVIAVLTIVEMEA